MDTKWFIVAGAVVGGLVLGTVLSAVTRRVLGGEGRDAKIREVAPALGGLVFSLFFIAGLWIALAVADPTAVETTPKAISSAMPNIVIAIIMVMGAKVVGSIVAVIAGQTIETVTGSRNSAIESAISGIILGLGVVLALNQIQISTTIINIMVAGIVGAAALSFALLVGFGGRAVARDISAGRALRATLIPGTRLRAGMVSGTIEALQPVSVQIRTDAGEMIHVPYHLLLESTMEVVTASDS
jgi:hypothetical protein